MPHFFRQRLFLGVVLSLLSAFPVLARSTNGLRWEKIHVYNTSPSVVFAKLGLTHSTKNGYTRDGKQGVPDPGFPPGLTDVVPDDAEKLLLVRGTAGGLSLFRARVTAADVHTLPMHLHAELTHLGSDTLLGTQDEDKLTDGVPKQIAVGDGDAARVYQITERANPDGTLWVACRVSLPLPDQSSLAPSGPVFIPERIWTDPLSRKVRPGETVQFDDLASVRQAAAQKLGATGTDAAEDYTLRITLTPIAPR
jgi:hypothetical protein